MTLPSCSVIVPSPDALLPAGVAPADIPRQFYFGVSRIDGWENKTSPPPARGQPSRSHGDYDLPTGTSSSPASVNASSMHFASCLPFRIDHFVRIVILRITNGSRNDCAYLMLIGHRASLLVKPPTFYRGPLVEDTAIGIQRRGRGAPPTEIWLAGFWREDVFFFGAGAARVVGESGGSSTDAAGP